MKDKINISIPIFIENVTLMVCNPLYLASHVISRKFSELTKLARITKIKIHCHKLS